jgi:hypothetical protein
LAVPLVVGAFGSGFGASAAGAAVAARPASASSRAATVVCTADARVAVTRRSATGKVRPLSIGTLRSRYLAIAGPSDKTFARFVNQLNGLNSAVSAAQLDSALRPAASAITSAANGFWCLHLASPPRVAADFKKTAVEDDLVYEGLLILAGNYGNRGFDIRAWGSRFRQALIIANGAQAQLRRDLGVH